MTDAVRYSVQLKDIPDTEQLIFKLIFTISDKAKGRAYKYSIQDDNESNCADIIIESYAGAKTELSVDVIPETIWIANQGEIENSQYVIERPLIATRVLSVLDRYLTQLLAQGLVGNAGQSSVLAGSSAVTETGDMPESASVNEQHEKNELTETDASSQAEVEFCITEEEASELAIVADETLSNPANAVPLHEPETTPAEKADTAAKSSSDPKLVVLKPSADTSDIENNFEAVETSSSETISTKPRALVVDDSPSVRKQIELELDLFEVDVDFAESVESAMAYLEHNHYDLAFLDVVLPDGDGFQICKTIKQSMNHIKVIMLTGKASAADKVKGTMVGCDAYLVKPVGRMTFQNTVGNYLKLRQQPEVSIA